VTVDLPEQEVARPSQSTAVAADPKGIRWYRDAREPEDTPNRLPSVTSILSATMPAARASKLEAWRARDPAAAARVMLAAQERGTAMHRMCEARFTGGKPNLEGFTEETVTHAARCFESCAAFLARIRHYVASELPFLEPQNRYAGTMDLVACLEPGELDLVDWKTAESWKDTTWVDDYRMQVAAYAAAWNIKEAAEPEWLAVYHCDPARSTGRGRKPDEVVRNRLPYVRRAHIVVANLYREAQVITMGRDELLARFVEFRDTRLRPFWAAQGTA
jgi:hypothetical protein